VFISLPRNRGDPRSRKNNILRGTRNYKRIAEKSVSDIGCKLRSKIRDPLIDNLHGVGGVAIGRPKVLDGTKSVDVGDPGDAFHVLCLHAIEIAATEDRKSTRNEWKELRAGKLVTTKRES
jgi:hypothetical protein